VRNAASTQPPPPINVPANFASAICEPRREPIDRGQFGQMTRQHDATAAGSDREAPTTGRTPMNRAPPDS